MKGSYSVTASKDELRWRHPVTSVLHPDSLPSVWCPGCGIGTVVYALVRAMEEIPLDHDRVSIVAGIGCTGKVVEYIELDSHYFVNGNILDHAADLAADKPDSKVVVLTNNADLLHMDGDEPFKNRGSGDSISIIHLNNLIYTVTQKGARPTTPFRRITGNGEPDIPFNLPHMAFSGGAAYVARWTPLHAGWLKYSIMDALETPGLSFIEVISPCLLYYTADGRIGDSVDRMNFYNDHAIMKHYEPTELLDLRADDNIIIGKFVDEQPPFENVDIILENTRRPSFENGGLLLFPVDKRVD